MSTLVSYCTPSNEQNIIQRLIVSNGACLGYKNYSQQQRVVALVSGYVFGVFPSRSSKFAEWVRAKAHTGRHSTATICVCLVAVSVTKQWHNTLYCKLWLGWGWGVSWGWRGKTKHDSRGWVCCLVIWEEDNIRTTSKRQEGVRRRACFVCSQSVWWMREDLEETLEG